MPAPSRWMIRISLLYLLAGFTIGAAMLASKAYPAYAAVWRLLPVHIEMLIFGFIIQFTMGTAYWILPRYLKTGNRGSSLLAGAMLGLFNIGIIINMASYLQYMSGFSIIWGRICEVAAALLFIAMHWNRAVSHRS